MAEVTWKLPSKEDFEKVKRFAQEQAGKLMKDIKALRFHGYLPIPSMEIQRNDINYIINGIRDDVPEFTIEGCAPAKTEYMKEKHEDYIFDEDTEHPYVYLHGDSEAPTISFSDISQMDYDAFVDNVKNIVEQDVHSLVQAGELDKETVEMPASDFWDKQKEEERKQNRQNNLPGIRKYNELKVIEEGIRKGNIQFSENMGTVYFQSTSKETNPKIPLFDYHELKDLPTNKDKLVDAVYNELHDMKDYNEDKMQDRLDTFIADVHLANQGIKVEEEFPIHRPAGFTKALVDDLEKEDIPKGRYTSLKVQFPSEEEKGDFLRNNTVYMTENNLHSVNSLAYDYYNENNEGTLCVVEEPSGETKLDGPLSDRMFHHIVAEMARNEIPITQIQQRDNVYFPTNEVMLEKSLAHPDELDAAIKNAIQEVNANLTELKTLPRSYDDIQFDANELPSKTIDARNFHHDCLMETGKEARDMPLDALYTWYATKQIDIPDQYFGMPQGEAGQNPTIKQMVRQELATMKRFGLVKENEKTGQLEEAKGLSAIKAKLSSKFSR